MSVFEVVVAVLLACSVIYTIWGWPRRYGALSGRSRLFRTVGLGLLNLLLILAMLWFYMDFGYGRIAVVRQLMYLCSCVLVVVFLLFIAAVDALETIVAARREEQALVHRMLQEELGRVRAAAGGRQGPSLSATDESDRAT